ncbi:MAG: nucleoside phosphorylase [Bacteroidales bacterium]|nr:nucleoside phosphorylase [Bacteroidales bacterium]
MNKIEKSELIINPDGSIYHLKIKPEHLADTVIIVGDPKRVEQISQHFDKIEIKIQNREFVTHTGTFKNKRLTVLATGIGTDNIDIVVNELDALVNINFKTRKRKEGNKVLDIIRLGTSGAIQADISVNSFVIAEYGLGFDGLIHFYRLGNEIQDHGITEAFINHTQWGADLARPYVVKGSSKLLKKLGKGMINGITATSPGFYGPQGRVLRLELNYPQINKLVETFSYNGYKITNFEMETSALYGLGKMLGHNTITICAIIANRITGEFNENYKEIMNNFIIDLINRITE